MKRFAIVIPITLASLFLLFFGSFNSVKQATLINLNIPFALIGTSSIWSSASST